MYQSAKSGAAQGSAKSCAARKSVTRHSTATAVVTACLLFFSLSISSYMILFYGAETSLVAAQFIKSSINSSFSNDVNATSPKELRFVPDAYRPKKKIVLFGAHDRYNFGDLLFEKVLSRLLVDRVGYRDDDIIRAGTISVNMSAHGGHSHVVGIKQVQRMSRAAPEGPFDIIFVGGEIMGCDISCAAGMMPKRKAEMVLSKQIYECAYLFPKELLCPLETGGLNVSRKSNKAIVNSIGGLREPHKACAAAILSADYVTFRDADPLAPDSAVMIKELYGDHVSFISEEVLNEVFRDADPIKNYSKTKKKYVAVQVNTLIGSANLSDMARALDEVSINTKCTIVFFVAGIAPGHDSLSVLRYVSSLMMQPSIVYDAENAWKVVALVSRAEAVLSTSLHVRIMAFIYHKPRFTWCTLAKHDAFIRIWDAPGSELCSADGGISHTWASLSKHFGTEYQRSTKKKYAEVVKLHLESFDKWSGILSKRS